VRLVLVMVFHPEPPRDAKCPALERRKPPRSLADGFATMAVGYAAAMATGSIDAGPS
jgi:hypothetical protein